MKLISALVALCSAQSALSFVPSSPAFVRQSTQVASDAWNKGGADMSGNTWKPNSESMGVRFLWSLLLKTFRKGSSPHIFFVFLCLLSKVD
jgi:hypothetical protein